jgi:hypothetical protein
MMVAAHFDQRDDGRFPSDDARAALQAALGGFVRSGGRSADEEAVCVVLRQLATEAHARQLHGEHLLVAFKRVWSEMPEVRAFRESGERQRLLDRLVTLCIDAYYRRG